MRSVRSSVISIARYLTSDNKGAVAVIIAIVIAVLVGFVGLAVDLSRVFTSNSEHQAHADAAVISGASQLDGTVDAIDRATAAIQNSLVQNIQTADGRTDVEIFSIRFLSSRPADDQPITAAYATTDPAEAICVEVTTRQADVDNTFIEVVGGPDTSAVSAVSVACSTQAVCDIPPMMMCNPLEADPAYLCTSEIGLTPGDQIRAKYQGGGGQWTPGGFGFLDPPEGGGVGAKGLAENLGTANPSIGCITDTVDVFPGQVASAMSGMNVRMDIFNNPFAKNLKNIWDFRPSVNVTKGYMPDGGVCNVSQDASVPAVAMGLPRDTNLAADPDARFGNGDWDRAGYWAFNHGGAGLPGGLNGASRYKVYRYEIDNGMIPDNSGNSPVGEDGSPQCHNDSLVTNDLIDRRMMIMAVVNCACEAANGNPINGNASDVPVIGFIKTFMTEPVTDPGDGMEYMFEFVGEIEAGNDDGVLHNIVQLYR